ncbi:D-2-hydroxyacid dehydrogenase [Phreatobacter sp. AB_2022a]|uniref:D-2-hydroxyacid dehydrogenase n=1 Tax=Phreatobacter sp. AB_2022a TaxID=3003134 RepID=UPI0022872798|nr:D-2-hydroxyacid dehydrogenase [Phreatobacter sp. AB_2022a]MCZ0738073.1 D-2-hydroxyacid dehydrogenase [Phreatobacter sp. AB_2022a]
MSFPAPADLTICFAHAAYRMGEAFARRGTGLRSFEVRSAEEFAARIGEADVIVVSGMWRNAPVERATRLRFIQSISAGLDQYNLADLRARNIRLASAQGVNANAVAEHAMGLILALTRKIHTSRDNQTKRFWRPMIGDPAAREDELAGKSMLIVGLGGIGLRLARFARAFDMKVTGVKRDLSARIDNVDQLIPPDRLAEAIATADIVALTCPLTPETIHLIDAGMLARMKPSALLVNCARGKVVDEEALIAALGAGRIAGAGLDVTAEEPLAEASPLWGFENVLITPHVGGETAAYEDRVVDLLIENLARLGRGEATLANQVI